MTERLRVAAPAKVNLFLHVGNKRLDGYHDIESLVAFTGCGDEIVLEADDGLSLSVRGPFAPRLPEGNDNLALKAARSLAERTGAAKGARIILYKHLPIASGIGGGSSDAAAVLRGLIRLWAIDAERLPLTEIAMSLGADVPACLVAKTCWMAGKGEHIRILPPIPSTGIVLVNPLIAVSTAQVFAALSNRRGVGMTPPRSFSDVHALVRFMSATTNDLEVSAVSIAPVIGDTLREMSELPEALIARMSGSGATCFALFADHVQARAGASLLRTRHQGWWIKTTSFVVNRSAISEA